MTYTITLQDAPHDMGERARLEAEARFRKTLERTLGGEEAVAPAYRAWQQAEESSESELSDTDITLARQWLTAAGRARSDGLHALGEGEAYFEVRLAR